MLAILFDMNMLWERFIYRILQRVPVELATRCPTKTPSDFGTPDWSNPILSSKLHRVKVIDTKWKLIRDGRPSDADLKQMFVYNLYWKTDRNVLLYPGVETWSGDWGRFYEGKPHLKSKPTMSIVCKVATSKSGQTLQAAFIEQVTFIKRSVFHPEIVTRNWSREFKLLRELNALTDRDLQGRHLLPFGFPCSNDSSALSVGTSTRSPRTSASWRFCFEILRKVLLDKPIVSSQ